MNDCICDKLKNVVFPIQVFNSAFYYPVPQYKELDVFIKRDQETGFGFRVLGGEGAEQPVSPYSNPFNDYFHL